MKICDWRYLRLAIGGCVCALRAQGEKAVMVSVVGLLCFLPAALPAAFVYESSTEFITSGDLNGDSIADVLVLDKSTGNARAGYQGSGGVLTWSAPLVTGVEHVSGCGVGRFVQGSREAVAVTSPVFNRLHYVDLSATNSATPLMDISPGVGPRTLVGLRTPFFPPSGSAEWLLVASSFNNPAAERLDVKTYLGGSSATASVSGPFERGNALQPVTNGPTFAVGLVRGVAGDVLSIWQFTNVNPSVIGMLSNLPPGSDYTFGNFNGEALPRFWFYVPGQSNVTIRPILTGGAGFSFGSPISLSFAQPIERVYCVRDGADGSAFIQFGDGIQGARLPGGSPALAQKYSVAAGSEATGLVPLDNGRFALLSAPAGATTSVRAQVMTFNGSTYTQLSASDLPSISRRTTRANVWLFQAEPFVHPAAGFVGSVNAPDWSSAVFGLPGSLSARVESDGGPSSGLRGPVTNNLGTPPPGAAFALLDQYRDDISIFTYAAARPSGEPVVANISPPPGSYGGSITISFSTLNPQHQVQYRTSPANNWQTYVGPFVLTNDATIHYYGRQPSTGVRAQLQFAAYSLGRSDTPPPTPATLPGGNTNPPPVVETNRVIFSSSGTLFYGRRSIFSAGTIWAINLDGGGDRYVTSGARPRVSSDGRYLAFTREGDPFSNRGNLWVRDLITGQETRLHVNNGDSDLVCYDWQYGRTNLLFDYSCNFWQVGLNGVASQLPMNVDCFADAPACNPVDGRLAFHVLNSTLATPGLYVSAPNFTTAQRLNVSAVNPRWPGWSPDGRQLVFVDSDNRFSLEAGKNLWVVSPDGTGLHQITGLGGVNGFPRGAIWSPAGDALVGYGTLLNASGIWILPLSENRTACEGEPRRLPTSPGDGIDFVGGIHLPAPPPQLFVRHDAGGVTVYWRRSVTPYVLEVTSDIHETASWSAVSGPSSAVGDFFEHFIPNGLLARGAFFRLQASY